MCILFISMIYIHFTSVFQFDEGWVAYQFNRWFFAPQPGLRMKLLEVSPRDPVTKTTGKVSKVEHNGKTVQPTYPKVLRNTHSSYQKVEVVPTFGCW